MAMPPRARWLLLGIALALTLVAAAALLLSNRIATPHQRASSPPITGHVKGNRRSRSASSRIPAGRSPG